MTPWQRCRPENDAKMSFLLPEMASEWCLEHAWKWRFKRRLQWRLNGVGMVAEAHLERRLNSAWKRHLKHAWTAPRSPKITKNLFICVLKGIFGEDGRLWYQLLYIFDLHYHQNICRIYLSIHLEHAFIHIEHTRIHFWILVEDVWIF